MTALPPQIRLETRVPIGNKDLGKPVVTNQPVSEKFHSGFRCDCLRCQNEVCHLAQSVDQHQGSVVAASRER